MIRTLKWYLGRDLAKITLLATAVFTLIMSVLAVIEPLRQRGLSGGQALQLFVFSLPVMLSFTLPVAALFAATFVYGRFSQDNELMACRASGISTLALMIPAIWLGVVVSVVTLTMGLYVAPNLLWQSRRAVRSNLERIAFHGLKSNRRLELGGYVFYADLVDPERHGLAGVLALKTKDPHNVLVLSSLRASLDFAQRAGGTYVTFQPDDPVVFSQKGGSVGMEDEQDMRQPMIEELVDDEPRMYDWSRLWRTWNNPGDCPGVQNDLRRIQRLVCIQAFLKDALGTLTSTGRYAALTEAPPGADDKAATHPAPRRVEIRSGQAEYGIDDSIALGKPPPAATAGAEALPLTADNCVVVRVYNGNELDRELRCFQASLRSDWDEARNAPRAWLELKDALVSFSANAREIGGRHDRLGLGPYAMPPEVTAAGSQVKLDNLMKMPDKGFGSESIDKAVTRLKKVTIRMLLARTQSEMHFRLSYAISTVFLVMLGAALGLLLRGGQALAAFAIGAAPTSLVVLTLYMGKELIRHINVSHAGPYGMGIVWGGVGVLVLGTLYVYLVPLRKQANMKTLDRYIVRNFLYSAMLCFVVLMSMRIIGDLFFNVDEFVKQRGGEDRTFAIVVGEIFTYYTYQSFAYFRELSGVIIVAAAAFTLARMNHTNELTAILASGVSLHRVLVPILLCAVGMDALVVIDNEVLIPRFKEYLVRSHDDATGSDSFRVRLLPDENRAAWYAYRYYPRQKTLEDPMVILRDEQYALLGHISAVTGQYNEADGGWAFIRGTDKSGSHPAVLHVPGVIKSPTTDFVPTFVGPEEILAAVMARPENANLDWPRAKWISDVKIPDDRAGLVIRGEKLELRQVDGKPVGTVLREPRFVFRMGHCDVEFRAASATFTERDNRPGWKLDEGRLVYHSPLTPGDLALRQSGQWIEYMSTSELTQLMDLGQSSDPDKLLMLKHSRFADFLNNIILLLIAVPFILSRERNIKSSAGLTVLTVGSVYILIYLTRYIGLPPVLAAWLPILICGPLAVLTVDSVKT